MSDSPAIRLQRAVEHIRKGELPQAQSLLGALLREAPNHPEIMQLLGVVHRRSGHPNDAIRLFRASLAQAERQPHVHNNLASALAATGDRASAETHYRRAIAIDPNFADARYNLALLLLDSDPAEAKSQLQTVVEKHPANANAFDALGLVLGKLGDTAGALAAAQRAVALAPSIHSTQHNLGQAAMSAGDFVVAERAFTQATNLAPSSDMSWIGLGHAVRSQGRNAEATRAYERAVEANPRNVDAHRLLNEVLWQSGEESRYLASYRPAIRAYPTDASLRLAYGDELIRVRQASLALVELQIAKDLAPANAEVMDALGRACAMLGDLDQAIAQHKRAAAAAPDDPILVQNYIEVLLKAAHHGEAVDASRAAYARFPHDQGVLAFHATALQLAGADEERKGIADFDALPKAFALDPPPGFADRAEFNNALADVLRSLHATKNHPTDQTLRGGTQTFGALFANHHPLIVQLKTQIEKAIARYIAEMPNDPAHPFFNRKAKSFAFSGSWSVRLSEGGYHTNHLHPKGWISSAYYVTLPPLVEESEPHAGWFKLGETNLQLGDREKVFRYIKPEVGHLILFPSYFWHGTVPFKAKAERLTVAFDVVPI